MKNQKTNNVKTDKPEPTLLEKLETVARAIAVRHVAAEQWLQSVLIGKVEFTADTLIDHLRERDRCKQASEFFTKRIIELSAQKLVNQNLSVYLAQEKQRRDDDLKRAKAQAEEAKRAQVSRAEQRKINDEKQRQADEFRHKVLRSFKAQPHPTPVPAET